MAADITGQVLGVEGKRLYLYHMEQTPAVMPVGESWSAAEIRERWSEISNKHS